MDPSHAQSDKSNDVHSLEQFDESKNAKTGPAENSQEGAKPDAGSPGFTDATGGLKPETEPPAAKKSAFRRLWEKFNLYLVLFVLVIVVAIGILVALTVKSNQQAETSLGTQNLSQQELQQLASTDVTVGNNKQTLTVQANAVFAGSVLVRKNLEVAGSLKIGGDLELKNLKVGGDTKLNDTQVNNLSVNGSLNLQGQLTLKNGLNVTGNSAFSGALTASSITTGALTLDGDLTLTHHITAGGPTPNISRGTAAGGGGTVSLSGSDTSGSITVNTGSSPPAGCFATITFSQKFNNTPHIIITPVGSSAAEVQYYIERSGSKFSVCSGNSAPANATFGFDYMAID